MNVSSPVAQTRKVIHKTSEELEIIRNNGDILGRAHAAVAEAIAPGVTTAKLDSIAYTFIKDHNAYPSFLNLYGFPASLCISVNDIVVHGIPGNLTLKEGDIISVDGGVLMNGFHADSAYTYAVGEIDEKVKQLLIHTKKSLYLGIEKAVTGMRMGDLSFAIQSYCERQGYSVVRELVGHGVGRELHEKPEVPNFGHRGKGVKLTDGMVLAIEPMINMGRKDVVQDNDGWTIRTRDGKPSAHFEHTVCVQRGKADVLTTFKYIEEVLTKKYGQAGIY